MDSALSIASYDRSNVIKSFVNNNISYSLLYSIVPGNAIFFILAYVTLRNMMGISYFNNSLLFVQIAVCHQNIGTLVQNISV